MKKLKFPIKAQLVTYDQSGDEVKKRKTLDCWFAFSEAQQTIEVALTDEQLIMQDISIDLKSLLKEVKKHDAQS